MAPQDPKTGAYALGPRMYDPQINRFVGSDFYAGAAANMQLQLDPMTGNRYLYAGANPVGLIDDGHGPGCGGIRWSKLREHCSNQWMLHRNHREVHGLCGECEGAYRQFADAFVNKYLPRVGARHGYDVGVLRTQAAVGLGRWLKECEAWGSNRSLGCMFRDIQQSPGTHGGSVGRREGPNLLRTARSWLLRSGGPCLRGGIEGLVTGTVLRMFRVILDPEAQGPGQLLQGPVKDASMGCAARVVTR